jgi:hypothetical protein
MGMSSFNAFETPDDEIIKYFMMFFSTNFQYRAANVTAAA